MKSVKYSENYQTVAQRHEVSKCYWKKMALIDLLDAGLPQNLHSVKHAISVKCN